LGTLETAILPHLAGDLRAAGFRRAGRTFRIQNADADWGLVNFQSSTRSTTVVQVVTVNLAVSLGLIRAWEDPADDRIPHYSEGHWDSRIGHLLPEHDDKWWSISIPIEDPSAVVDLRRAVRDVGIPAVIAHMSATAIRDLWMAGPVPFLPNLRRLRDLLIVLSRIGPRDRFDEFADLLRVEAAGVEWWEDKVETTIERLQADMRSEPPQWSLSGKG